MKILSRRLLLFFEEEEYWEWQCAGWRGGICLETTPGTRVKWVWYIENKICFFASNTTASMSFEERRTASGSSITRSESSFIDA